MDDVGINNLRQATRGASRWMRGPCCVSSGGGDWNCGKSVTDPAGRVCFAGYLLLVPRSGPVFFSLGSSRSRRQVLSPEIVCGVGRVVGCPTVRSSRGGSTATCYTKGAADNLFRRRRTPAFFIVFASTEFYCHFQLPLLSPPLYLFS